MNDQEQDIFGEVAETEALKPQNDLSRQLYIIPEGVADTTAKEIPLVSKNGFFPRQNEKISCYGLECCT